MTQFDPSPRLATPKPYVLFVVNDARFVVTHRLTLILGLRNAGYKVEVAAPDDGKAATTIREAGVTLHDVPIDRQGVNPFNDIRALVTLVKLYARQKPWLVHHVTVKPVLYGSLAARVTRVPAVVNAISGLGALFAEDGLLARARSSLFRMLYRTIVGLPNSQMIFQNAHDRSKFIRAGIIADRNAVLIPGSGVLLRSFMPDVEPEEPPIVMLPARLLRRKGVREFAEAAKILRDEGSNARFVLLGDTASNRDAVPVSELQRWQDEKIIELWGWADDMPTAVSRAAIICLPSYYPEGVPKALLDACAGGRPIVTTDTPGCNDVVSHGYNGFLVPPRDSVALAAALRELLGDSRLRSVMGARGRELAEHRFDISHVIRATIDMYESLAHGDRTSHNLAVQLGSQK